MTDALREQIRAFILENYLFTADQSALGLDDSLLERGIVDSTGMLEIIFFIEEQLGVKVKDITGGYRAYRREVLEALDLDSIESQGYCFQVDLAWRLIQGGATVVEVPITFTEREIGESKMSGNIVREALLKVTAWGFKNRIQKLKNLTKRRKAAA